MELQPGKLSLTVQPAAVHTLGPTLAGIDDRLEASHYFWAMIAWSAGICLANV